MVRVLPTRAELRAPSSPSFQTITQSERGADRFGPTSSVRVWHQTRAWISNAGPFAATLVR